MTASEQHIRTGAGGMNWSGPVAAVVGALRRRGLRANFRRGMVRVAARFGQDISDPYRD